MIINGHTLTQFQRCKRPIAISQTHNITKWRPQSLLSACLRMAIFNLSNDGNLEKATTRAVGHFLNVAKNPGLDVVGVDTYMLAMDYCAVIRNVLEYLSRLTLLSLRAVPDVSLSATDKWRFLSHMDESGVLHKWKFVDHLSKDITADLHSWEVFGDVAAAEAPMMLHVLAVGKRDGSHQNSPWCRVYAHPNLANIYKFQKKSKEKLDGEWKPKYYTDNSQNTPAKWVDLMLADNVPETLIQHVSIKEVSAEHQKLFDRDVAYEVNVIHSVVKADPRTIPLSRYVCDKPYPCPHQFYCYNTNLTLDNAGIYTRKSGGDNAGTGS